MSIYLEQLIQWNMQWFGWLSHQVSGGLAYMRQFHMESAIFRMALALFCGGIIGVEWGRKNRAAGFRTHMQVCLGASITILLGQYEYTLLSSNPLATVAKTDVTRYGAQVISGVGFLGAGTILVTRGQQVRGLTTAAGLWAVAIVGLALGAGYFELSLIATVLILLAEAFLSAGIGACIVPRPPSTCIWNTVQAQDLEAILQLCRAFDLRILDIEFTRQIGAHQNAALILLLRPGKKQDTTKFLRDLRATAGVEVVAEL